MQPCLYFLEASGLIRVVKFLIHPKTTKRKMAILEKTAKRCSASVRQFLRLMKNGVKPSELEEHRRDVMASTGLNGAFTQQARDKAAWMVKSQKGKRGSFPEPHGIIPVKMDQRNSRLVINPEANLTRYWLKMSTLRMRETIWIPLKDSGSYQRRYLKGGDVTSLEMIKKRGRWYAHATVKIPDPQPLDSKRVMAIDLGCRHSAVTAVLDDGIVTSRGIGFYGDGEANQRTSELETTIASLQRDEKWRALKRYRGKIRRVNEHRDMRMARLIVSRALEMGVGTIVVGHPKNIRQSARKGNGKPILRRIVNRWSFYRMLLLLTTKAEEAGIRVVAAREQWTSRRCHVCSSMKTMRPTQGQFVCLDRGLEYNADLNAAINIGLGYMSRTMGAFRSACTRDDSLEEREEPRTFANSVSSKCAKVLFTKVAQ